MVRSLEGEGLLTAEEFWRLSGDGTHRELVRGEVVETALLGARQGLALASLAGALKRWSLAAGGWVGLKAGFVLGRRLDTVRGCNAFYIRSGRLLESSIPEGFLELAPDLAVLIVPPGTAGQDTSDRVGDFLAAGTPLVWVLQTNPQQVVVHAPDGLARTLAGDAALEHPEVLPGFRCAVADPFE